MFSFKLIYWFKTLSKFISAQLVVQVLGFASGILLIRTLSKEEYAYFIIGNTMLGAMNILADTGISISLSAIGGKVWQDRYCFSQLINTAMQLRRYLAIIAITVVTPILLWLLIAKGATATYSVLIAFMVLVGLNFQLSNGVLIKVPQLYSQINRVQNSDLIFAISRLTILFIFYLTFLNTALAILAASISYGLQKLLLDYWVADSIDTKAPISKEYRSDILKIAKAQAPNVIYYCIKGQLTIWLISIFGNTQNIAEFGALGRLAIIFSIFNKVMSSIFLPSFAKCQSYKKLFHRYWQIIIFFCIFGFLLVLIAALFPNQIIWIFGKNYANLQNEVIWMLSVSLFTYLAGSIWAINASKSWIEHSWVYIPMTLVTQIILLFFLDFSTVRGVIIFEGLSQIPFFIVNLFLSYRGFRSYK